MKFVFLDPTLIEDKIIKKIKYLSGITEVKVYEESPVNDDEIAERIYDADLVTSDIHTKLSSNVLKKAKNLKALFTQSVGYDNYDIAYATKKDIPVYSCYGYNSNSVAEFAFSLIVNLTRQISLSHDHVKAGGWDYKLFKGSELAGKTLGIIGGGNIGMGISRIGHGYNMNVMVNTLHPTKAKAEILGVEKFSSFKDVIKKSDFIILAVPLNDKTKGMIGRKELDMMKKTAFLINVARQTIVDEYQLAKAIIEKRIGGAALDVILEEPFDSKLSPIEIREMINLPNVIVTPHIAGTTEESINDLGKVFFQNVKSFLAGDRRNCVNF